MRVHVLAKELNVPSKTIIEKCKAEGVDVVKNHMSTLSAGLHATILEWFSDGSHNTTIETAKRIDIEKVRVTSTPKEAAPPEDVGGVAVTATAEAPVAPVPDVVPVGDAVEVADAPVDLPVEQPTDAPAEPTEVVGEPAAPSKPDAGDAVPGDPAVVVGDVAPVAPEAPVEEPAAPPKPVIPAGPQNVPQAAKLQGPRVVRYEAPDYDTFTPRRSSPTPGGSTGMGGSGGPMPASPPGAGAGDAAKKRGRAGGARRSGGKATAGEKLAEWRDRDLAERRQRLAGATGRRIHRRRSTRGGGGGPSADVGPKTEATVHEPVRLKEFCSETGVNFIQLFKVLQSEHDIVANINMAIPTETAQLLALNFGIELTVVPARTKLDELKDECEARERKHLKPRPPVVAMLGHVDHGKTSLLDAIRSAHVAAGEDGGITQHISSYHIETAHGSVTFIDTPGHEAFTAMRARGAQITDVVVLVVAADDGLMPQTIEAIRHAQAAEVPIVVALNKIDLGDQNVVKIYGQLAEHQLTPSGDWGGDTDVIQTSATTNIGVTELVEHLADLSGLLELKADATLPAVGTVIEAETKPGVGSVVRLLVQEGTLKEGNFIVCGGAFGKVRAILDDRGNRIKSAGPSMPVEVWGLDDVPMSGDKLYAVSAQQIAKEIATETKQKRTESARLQSRKVKSLEEMFKRVDTGVVPELNVIIKADVDGSLVALKHSLMEIPSEEVNLTIRHAAVGPVNDSDVLLAATSNGIVLAFRVEVPVGTRRLAENQGVDVRNYRVIYECCDDVRKALSGLLTPDKHVESRATIDVRQVFRITKAGMVAGSYVTDGVVNRNHFVKILRDGAVVREGCRFASLKHFKDDVKEVRAGLECGLRLEGYDDIHVGDTLETYEIIEVARSL